MDLELLEWLNTRTFPEEAKYSDMEYARKAYTIFAENMKHSATTRACIFATMHREATELLMDLMEDTADIPSTCFILIRYPFPQRKKPYPPMESSNSFNVILDRNSPLAVRGKRRAFTVSTKSCCKMTGNQCLAAVFYSVSFFAK